MKINIKVQPDSKENKIVISDKKYLIKVKAPAKENKANLSVIKLLSRHFNLDCRKIKLKGLKSRNKIAEIQEWG